MSVHPVAPSIETERLLLRGHNVSDLEAVHRLWSEETVVRYITGQPSSREECWDKLLKYAGMWPLMGFGYWAMTEKHSGEFLGDVGFLQRDAPADAYTGAAPEIGWAISPDHEGQGLAREASSAAIKWLRSTNKFAGVTCSIDRRNSRSLALAARLGFVVTGDGESVRGKLKLQQFVCGNA